MESLEQGPVGIVSIGQDVRTVLAPGRSILVQPPICPISRSVAVKMKLEISEVRPHIHYEGFRYVDLCVA